MGVFHHFGKHHNLQKYQIKPYISYSFTILGLWVLGLATSNINESPLQTNESSTLFLMTSLPYYCILGLAEIKTYAQKMQDEQVTKSLYIYHQYVQIKNPTKHPLNSYSDLNWLKTENFQLSLDQCMKQ